VISRWRLKIRYRLQLVKIIKELLRRDATGSAGWASIDTSHAFDWENRVWSIGPSVSIPIFTGGQLTAQLEQTRARYEELNANYRGTILAAYRDVEDSLTDLHLRADEAQSQDQAVQYAREYLRLSEIQYKGGLTNYLIAADAIAAVLDTDVTLRLDDTWFVAYAPPASPKILVAARIERADVARDAKWAVARVLDAWRSSH